MLLFAILLVILAIVLIVFVCCLLFRTRTEYKKQPFRKKKTRQVATLVHRETPRDCSSPLPAAPNPAPTKTKFGAPTPFTEADTYPLQRSKGIQKTPPLTLDRETQRTPIKVENRETQWTPDSSVKGGNWKSSGSSQDSSPPIRIPIERLERSEIFV
uniref:Uncharacterized protein n=1 Tax=Acrobeloides nanus TaxID=290746 RepID=A0A914DCY0_9BILA